MIPRNKLSLLEANRGSMPGVVKRFSRKDMLELMIRGEMRGKHGAEWGEQEAAIRAEWEFRLKAPHYVLVGNVPINALNMEHDPTGRYTSQSPSAAQSKRIKKYAASAIKFDPIYITLNARSSRRAIKRGEKPKAYVANGNHRVSVAITRGQSTIDAFMPVLDWERFQEVIGE